MSGDRCRYSRYHTSLAIVADTAGTIKSITNLAIVSDTAGTGGCIPMLHWTILNVHVLAAMQSPHAVHELQLSLANRLNFAHKPQQP